MDEEAFYQILGQKIRDARKRRVPRLSQQNLAVRLGISRASIVNIEAGRQHPPLHLLWNIAEALSTDVPSLIPSQPELMAPTLRFPLDRRTMREIERASGGNPDIQNAVTAFIDSLRSRTGDADDGDTR